jgi:2-keto-4-pentenoate hydratase
MTTQIAAAANALVVQHDARTQFRSLAPMFPLADLGSAYDVQDAFVERLLNRRNTIAAGYKIGLTSPRMQEMCGTKQPIVGVIASAEIENSPASLSSHAYARLGIEFEICARLASDLPRHSRLITRFDAAAAVEAVAVAVEIIDDRNAVYEGLDILSVIADNSWNNGVVLGEFRKSWPDLADVEGVLSRDGGVIDNGFGREILGHPFESVAWLANHLADRGRTLRAGELVMTGSILRTRFPKIGERYNFAIASLGEVAVDIAN